MCHSTRGDKRRPFRSCFLPRTFQRAHLGHSLGLASRALPAEPAFVTSFCEVYVCTHIYTGKCLKGNTPNVCVVIANDRDSEWFGILLSFSLFSTHHLHCSASQRLQRGIRFYRHGPRCWVVGKDLSYPDSSSTSVPYSDWYWFVLDEFYFCFSLHRESLYRSGWP